MDIDEFELLVNDLKSSDTEELIIDNITSIVRKFEPNMYKDLILSNVYYKDIFFEVRENVILELLGLKDDISEEISSISRDIIKHPDEEELEGLKKYCIFLLEEVDRKIIEINSIK